MWLKISLLYSLYPLREQPYALSVSWLKLSLTCGLFFFSFLLFHSSFSRSLSHQRNAKTTASRRPLLCVFGPRCCRADAPSGAARESRTWLWLRSPSSKGAGSAAAIVAGGGVRMTAVVGKWPPSDAARTHAVG